MKVLFIELLQCTLSMSIITILYVVLLPLISKRYAARWQYIVWLVIAAGWMFPLRPEGNLSFFSSPIPVPVLSDISVQPMNHVLPSIAIGEEIVTTSTKIPLWWVFMGIWVVGVISVVLFYGLRHVRFMKVIRRWSEPITNSRILEILGKLKLELAIKAPIKLAVCQGISSPMLIGFFHPTILLPHNEIEEDQLSLILNHELIHFKRHDLWFKAMVLGATALHWFNPVVYLMAKATAVQCEISCDALVLQKANFHQRKRYGQTMISVAKDAAKSQTALSTNFYGGKRDMKNRLTSIMDTKHKKQGIIILCIVIAGILTTGATLTAADMNSSSAFEEKATQYSLYTKYGLTYNQEKDRFFYDGQLVRFFADKLNEDGVYNSFSYLDGDIDLRAVRNAKFELIGVEPVSKDEYNQRTTKIQTSMKDLSGAQENASSSTVQADSIATETEDNGKLLNNNSSATEQAGDLNGEQDDLNAYIKHGITYNQKAQVWLYQGKPLHCLYDEGYITFVDNSDVTLTSGVSLKVVRNAKGDVMELEEMTRAEVDKLIES